MGGNQSQDSQKFIQNFQQQYMLVKDTNDPRFGEIQIYRNKTGRDMIMVKSQWSQTEMDFKACLQKCERRNLLDNKHLIKLLGYHTNSSNQLCGDFTKVSIYYEYYENTLEKLVESKQSQKIYFTEQELWRIMDQFVSTCVFLEKNGKFVGDIRPSNTMIDWDGRIKLAEHGIVQGDKTGFQRAYYNQEKAYLAPEFLPFIQEQIPNPPPVTQKSDVFSLGITMLECATLISCKSLYSFNRNAMQLNIMMMNQLLDQFPSLGFSQTLFRMIREMLRERPEERPSFDDINGVLEQFRSQIQSLQPFSLHEPSSHYQQSQSIVQQPNTYVTLNPSQNVFESQIYQPTPVQNQIPVQQQQQQQPQQVQSFYQQQSSLYQYQPQPQTQPQPQQQPSYQYQPPQQPQTINPPIQSQIQPQMIAQIQQPQQSIITQSPQRIPQSWQQPQTQVVTQQVYGPRQPSVPQYFPQTTSSQYQPYETQPEVSYYPQELHYVPSQPVYEDLPQFRAQAPQQPVFDQDHDQGLSDLDLRIQRALKSSQDTANRHYQTPSYY